VSLLGRAVYHANVTRQHCRQKVDSSLTETVGKCVALSLRVLGMPVRLLLQGLRGGAHVIAKDLPQRRTGARNPALHRADRDARMGGDSP
jgi:hypothetical protein